MSSRWAIQNTKSEIYYPTCIANKEFLELLFSGKCDRFSWKRAVKKNKFSIVHPCIQHVIRDVSKNRSVPRAFLTIQARFYTNLPPWARFWRMPRAYIKPTTEVFTNERLPKINRMAVRLIS